MSVSYKKACDAPSLEGTPNLSATKIESQSDSYAIVENYQLYIGDSAKTTFAGNEINNRNVRVTISRKE